MSFGVDPLLKFCIFAVKFFILIDGAPEGFSNAHRVIIQGDSFPPLFLLAMEGLNNMVKIAKVNGSIQG